MVVRVVGVFDVTAKVAFSKSAGGSGLMVMWCGQVFEDLDVDLQEEFVKHLEDFGLTPEFNQQLIDLSQDKEQREYMGWLDRVYKFVA
jgi:complement component 1 Q subcomponent-binding protein, mitochondrial